MRTPQTRELISIKCREKLEKKKQNLEYIGKSIPYGYILDKTCNKLIIDKKTSHVVYTIFDLYDKGYGFTTIADYLNDRGILSPAEYAKKNEYIKYYDELESSIWKKGTIRKIILNKVYTGSYLYTNQITHEAIINKYLWDTTRDRLNAKITNSGRDFYDHNGNEFCGKVFCSICAKPFTIETSICKDGNVKYLRCSCYDKRGNHKYECENKLAIRYNELRDVVSFFVEQDILCNLDVKKVQEEYLKVIKDERIETHRLYLKQEKSELNKLILSYEKKLSTINNMNLYNEITINDLKKRIDNYKSRLEEIEKILKEIYSFARQKNISTKDFFMDKFIIDIFINRIDIGILENNERNINIILN